MKKILLLLIIITSTNTLWAKDFKQSILEAYKNNPILNAERENLNISKENLKISKSEYLPTISLSGTKNKQNTSKLTNQSGGDAAKSDVDPLTTSVLIEQNIYDGKARGAKVDKDKIGIELAKAKLLKVEQEIIYQAIEAYTALLLAVQKLEINEENLKLLERQYENDKARLEIGKINNSDLAQTESSLAGAKANLIKSQNDVITGKLTFENIIGPLDSPDKIDENVELAILIPSTLSEANNISLIKNPNLKIAKLEYQQSEKDVIIARSDLSPSATLSYEASQSEDASSLYDEQDKQILKATVKWPFFTGGKNRAKVNKNSNLKTQKKLLLDNSIKSNKTTVATSWANYETSKSLLVSVKIQLKAAEIAYDGISAEYEAGDQRSTLDVIQSNSFLLNSKINLAESERNFILAKYKLLQSIGSLDISSLNLN